MRPYMLYFIIINIFNMHTLYGFLLPLASKELYIVTLLTFIFTVIMKRIYKWQIFKKGTGTSTSNILGPNFQISKYFNECPIKSSRWSVKFQFHSAAWHSVSTAVNANSTAADAEVTICTWLSIRVFHSNSKHEKNFKLTLRNMTVLMGHKKCNRSESHLVF